MDLVRSFNSDVGSSVLTALLADNNLGGRVREFLSDLGDGALAQAFGEPVDPNLLRHRQGPMNVVKEEVITKDSASRNSRKGDNLFKRHRQNGDDVVINVQQQDRPTRLSLGRSLSLNNTHILHELLNRRTSVSTSGGYMYTAGVANRAWHMQHFRHNAYNSAIVADYTYQKLTEDNSGASSTISLITPVPQVQGGGQSGVPYKTSAYKPVTSNYLGDVDQYSPYSLTDLENVSFNLQQAKHFISPASYATTTSGDQKEETWSENPLLLPKNAFASRSRIYEQNQFIGEQFSPVQANAVVDNTIKCKPMLLGGKVEYLFTNTGTAPASITVVVYKVKTTYNNTLTLDNPVVFQGEVLKEALVTTATQAYLDKGMKLRLKTMDGRTPVKEDVTINSKFQFLPNNKPVVASSCPYVEQMRYNYVIAAGQSKNIDVSLPGRMYNPCSVLNTVSYAKTETINAVDTNAIGKVDSVGKYPQFWSGEQYSIAIGVAGCPAIQQFDQTQTISGQGTVVRDRQGTTTTSATVQCRVKYTERIGAMNMTFKSRPTVGTSSFDPPVATQEAAPAGATGVSSVAIIPLVAAERFAPESGVTIL